MSLHKGEDLKKLGLFDAIMMSPNTPPSHKPRISATLMFWCKADHSFHFRVGSMVPTMLEVVYGCLMYYVTGGEPLASG